MTKTRAKNVMALITAGVSYRSAAKQLGMSLGQVAGLIYRVRHPEADAQRDRRKLDTEKSRWTESRLTERWSGRNRHVTKTRTLDQ